MRALLRSGALSRARARSGNEKCVRSEKILGRALTDALENAEPRCHGEAEGGYPGYSIDRAHGHADLAVRRRHHILVRSIDHMNRPCAGPAVDGDAYQGEVEGD